MKKDLNLKMTIPLPRCKMRNTYTEKMTGAIITKCSSAEEFKPHSLQRDVL
jgi:hypothetical protein